MLGDVQSIEQTDRSVLLRCDRACLQITVLAANLVRVRLAPTGELAPRRSWSVARADEAWEAVPVAIAVSPTAIELKTEQIRVQIDRVPCRITCFDPTGEAFAEDAALNLSGEDSGSGMGWSASGVSACKRIAADEHFYGFGERTGLLDKLEERKTNWTVDALDYSSQTDEMYQAIPFFLALRPALCYGIFLNSTFWSQFDLGVQQPGFWQMQTRSTELDYYVIYGVNACSNSGNLHRADRADAAAAKMGTRLSPVSLELRIRRDRSGTGAAVSPAIDSLRCDSPGY